MCLFLFPFTADATTRYSVETNKDIVYRVFSVLGEDIANEALFIAFCESEYDNLVPNHGDIARNGFSSIGLMQVSLIHGYDTEYLMNPYNNARVALSLYKKNGWKPWKICSDKLKLIT